jgi:osmoprotectant transport system ATP-binding protein
MALLELQAVSKRYGSAVALHPVTLSVAAGEVIAVVGESGSGKSTMLRLLAALDVPSAGQVRVDGVSVEPGTAPAIRRKLGFLVQGGGLFPHLTAEQNITLVARVLKWPEDKCSQRVETLRALTRLPPEALARYPVQLSGGQIQRVALMRALMLDPGVLLLDEPFGALDPITRYELQAELAEIFATLRKTVVLVTHDLGEAFFFAQRVLVLQAGHVVQEGTPRSLQDSPASAFVEKLLAAHRPAVAGR